MTTLSDVTKTISPVIWIIFALALIVVLLFFTGYMENFINTINQKIISAPTFFG